MDTDDIGPCREFPGGRDSDGYGRIRRGRSSTTQAHRALWIAVHGEVPEVDGKPGMILHRCDNPPCWRLDHLYCGSHLDNMRDMVVAGRQAVVSVPGTRNGQAKLADEDVRQIRMLCALGERQVDVARRFGVAQSQVSEIVRRRAWAHVT